MHPPNDPIAYEDASIEIAASPEDVYALVSDITRMGEWSPENVGGRWLDGGTGVAGDRFEGHNRSGERAWSRECEVVVAKPGRDFTFVVGGVEANQTWWSYEMEPIPTGNPPTGTEVTERWWIANKTPAMEALTAEQFAARVAFTQTMLQATLAAVKHTAEGAPRRPPPSRD